ncbi:hypothetical protein HPB50_008319 [Hyalomma asiaticum]|uniref:Uncharacterized protein n=1 Tax=Hyalomma asiaticum TaxID=266040 RepID=A0ACB7SYQ3_HYAAI|nr:hypothetical protein HPB50_008319 [Hyalomma asiaticum]
MQSAHVAAPSGVPAPPPAALPSGSLFPNNEPGEEVTQAAFHRAISYQKDITDLLFDPACKVTNTQRSKIIALLRIILQECADIRAVAARQAGRVDELRYQLARPSTVSTAVPGVINLAHPVPGPSYASVLAGKPNSDHVASRMTAPSTLPPHTARKATFRGMGAPAKEPRTTSRSPRHSPRRGTTTQGCGSRCVEAARTGGQSSSSRPNASRRHRAGVYGGSDGSQESRSRLLFLLNGLAIATFCVLVTFFVVYTVRSAGTVNTAGVERRSHPGRALRPAPGRHPLRESFAAAGVGAAIPENTRFVCVYHEENRRPGYSPDTFPYAYCHVVAYCCLSVNTAPEDTQALQSIARLARAHKPIAIIVKVGAGQTDTDLTALFGAWRASQFTARLLDVRRRTAFCCVYLHWRRPSTIYRERVTRLASDLRAALRDYGVRFGFVVDSATVEALNVRTLLATLGPESLLVAPAPYPPPSSGATYHSYHNYEALRWHSRLAELAGNESSRACHTVSLAGLAMTAANVTLLPYDRICTARFLRTPKTIRDGWSSMGRLWGSGALVSFLSPGRARSFLAAVHEEAGTNCLGFWDPEHDDIAARCGGPEYPLIGAVVKRLEEERRRD